MVKNSSETTTTIIKYWNNTSPFFKKCTLLYFSISVGFFFIYNYNDGKRELLNYRKQSDYKKDNEFYVTKRSINGFENFFSALFFPYSMFEKVIPGIVIMMNKE